MAIQNEKDLGEALKNEEDTIEIVGDLKKKVLRIKATGNVAWAIAVGAIGVAVLGIVYPVPEPTTQTGSKLISAASAAGAVTILGVGATTAAISIAFAAGGVGALNSLRTYTIVDQSGDKLILKKKA